MNQNENLLGLVNAIYRWRKPIILSCLAAIAISIVVSLMLPNYYTSTTKFYAASPDLANPMPIGSNGQDREIYGTGTDLDRLFSIANSTELVDYVIEEFNLFEHYEIDPSHPKAEHTIRLKIDKAFTTEKNKYDALELSFEDKDPAFATKLAKAARNKIDQIAQQVIKSSQSNLLKNYELTIKSKETSQQIMQDTLTKLKTKYQIFNSYSKAEILGEQLMLVEGKYLKEKSKLSAFKQIPSYRDSVAVISAYVQGLKRQLDQLKVESANYSEGSGPIERIGVELREMGEQLALDKEHYKQLKAAYDTPFSALHLIQKAEIPKAKSRPIRSVIVLGSTALMFFLSIIWAILMEQYKGVNWKKIFSDEPSA